MTPWAAEFAMALFDTASIAGRVPLAVIPLTRYLVSGSASQADGVTRAPEGSPGTRLRPVRGSLGVRATAGNNEVLIVP